MSLPNHRNPWKSHKKGFVFRRKQARIWKKKDMQQKLGKKDQGKLAFEVRPHAVVTETITNLLLKGTCVEFWRLLAPLSSSCL